MGIPVFAYAKMPRSAVTMGQSTLLFRLRIWPNQGGKVTHPFWNFETLGIVLALFGSLLFFAFCFGIVFEAAKTVLWRTLWLVSRCLPMAWRVAVVRRVPWLWNAQWRETYLMNHCGR